VLFSENGVLPLMKRRTLLRRCFSGLAFILFHRDRSLWFCLLFSAVSLGAELKFCIDGLFACSGAVISVAGLFLNIKHSLHFHLDLPKQSIFYMLAGMGPMGANMTKEDEERVDDVISDEIFGVAFMIIGTLVWAYGDFVVRAIS